MNLQQQIDNDLKESMKAKQAQRLGVLRMLKAALKNLAIEKGGPAVVLEEAEVAAVIRKQVKQRQDSIESFTTGGRPELAAKEEEELAILNTYLPQALSADELTAIVKAAIAEIGATSKAQMGLVMKAAKEKAAGRADGKALSLEVQRQLS
ncbi:MAG: GatB/YqeY domain-containing protein [Chthoniobacteraceae bacterium]